MPNLKVKVEKNKDQEMDLSASSYSQMDSHNSAMTPVQLEELIKAKFEGAAFSPPPQMEDLKIPDKKENVTTPLSGEANKASQRVAELSQLMKNANFQIAEEESPKLK